MNGSRDIQTRARAKAEKLLTEYEAPKMDIAIKEALDSFVEKRQGLLPALPIHLHREGL